jgi:4-amino-4-deoxy-L-arabinose transferase-like glycosyltransferase
MRHSRAKFALLFLVMVAVVEIGLWFTTPPADRADMFGTAWVHGLIVGIFFLAWLVAVVRGPTFALAGDGVWVALRGWPRSLALWLPWTEIARVVEARHQWHRAVGLVVREPALLTRESLGRNIGYNVMAARRDYGTDLSASLTLADAGAPAVAGALARFAPPTVDVRMTTSADPRPNSPARWVGRIAVTAGWVVLFLFLLPAVVLGAIGSPLNSVPGLLVPFVSAGVGTATLPRVLTAYERFVQRGRPPADDVRSP